MEIDTLVTMFLREIPFVVAMFVMAWVMIRALGRRLDSTTELLKTTIIQVGMAVGWSDKAPFIEVLRALLTSIELGANGNFCARVVEIVLGQGKQGVQLYRSMLSEYNPRCKDNTHFKKCVAWIDERLM